MLSCIFPNDISSEHPGELESKESSFQLEYRRPNDLRRSGHELFVYRGLRYTSIWPAKNYNLLALPKQLNAACHMARQTMCLDLNMHSGSIDCK